MVVLVIRGTEDLEKLARALKHVGSGPLRRELLRTIQRATRPFPQAVKGRARSTLPQRGGLAALVAGSRVTTRSRIQGRTVGVSVTASSGVNVEAIDHGRLHHPLFGDKGHWYTQTVQPGWFTKPAQAMTGEIHADVSRSLKAFADKHLSN